MGGLRRGGGGARQNHLLSSAPAEAVGFTVGPLLNTRMAANFIIYRDSFPLMENIVVLSMKLTYLEILASRALRSKAAISSFCVLYLIMAHLYCVCSTYVRESPKSQGLLTPD